MSRAGVLVLYMHVPYVMDAALDAASIVFDKMHPIRPASNTPAGNLSPWYGEGLAQIHSFEGLGGAYAPPPC
ncbi:MAG: hypothetical protein ACOCW2_02655 [Chitinivibrionales bacterium]